MSFGFLKKWEWKRYCVPAPMKDTTVLEIVVTKILRKYWVKFPIKEIIYLTLTSKEIYQ